jgi:hypothetical protein
MRRRGVALTGLAMVIAGGIWAAVAWASTTVEISGLQGNESVDVNEIPNNVDETYNVDGRPQRIEGDSLQHVLNKVGVNSDEWTRIYFDAGVVRNDEKFTDDRDPVFYLSPNGENVWFLIPKKEGEPARTIKSDLDFTYRGAIDIDPDEIDPDARQGDTQEFTATVRGVNAQNDYKFNWTAGSQTGTGRTFEVTFSSSGRTVVNVEATRFGNIAAEQTIAGAVKEPEETDTGTGTGGTGFGSSGYDSGYDTSYDYPSASDYDSNFPDAEIPDSVPDDVKPPDAETTPLEDAGVSVSGELLSATTPLPPSSGDAGETAEESAPDPEAAVEEAEEINAPGALIAAGVVVGLLGLGAGREMETVRPRRIRRPDLSGLRRLLPPWK